MRARWTLLALAAVACGEAEPPAPVPYAALVTAIQDQVTAAGIAGLAAARIEGGSVVWEGTFGFADYEARRPVSTSTPFLVASISKTFVSVLLAQLAASGAIDLDQPIDRFFTQSMRPPGHPDSPVTARALATHSSGLQDDWLALAAATTEGDYSGTLESFATGYWTAEHFAAVPGAEHRYCNAGFGVLGAVVEAAAGQPLPELTRARIFDPLGLTDSGWRLADVDPAAVAIPYSGTRQEGLVRGEHEGFAFYPATSMRTSVRDLARFLSAFMRDGAGLLDAQTARAMRDIQDPALDADQALVWYYDRIGERRYLGHTGSAVGASALMFFDPDTQVGAVVLSNSDAFLRSRFGHPEGSKALYQITQAVLEATP